VSTTISIQPHFLPGRMDKYSGGQVPSWTQLEELKALSPDTLSGFRDEKGRRESGGRKGKGKKKNVGKGKMRRTPPTN